MKTYQRFKTSACMLGLGWAIACTPQANEGDTQGAPAATIVDKSNSRDALDWAGTYRGTTPCADCEGIATAVTLYADGRYRRSLNYLGKEESNFYQEEGNFEWDDAGAKVMLTTEAGLQQYQVGENVLFHLDQSGARISGDLASWYRLPKNLTDFQLEAKTWQLTELMGAPYEAGEHGKIPALQFDAIEGRVAGNDGCNQLMGGYTLEEGSRIRFDRLAGTMMACPGMEGPDAFRKMLEQVDNYHVSDSALVLNKARMAPMARFEPLAP